MKKTVMIVHRGVDADPKCGKLIDALVEQNYNVIFVGWNVNPGTIKPQFAKSQFEKKILEYKSPLGLRALFSFPKFILFFYKNLILKKPEIIHCVNEEVAMIALLGKGILYKKIVIDVFDSLGFRVNTNKLIQSVLGLCCHCVYSFSDLIIVTNKLRYGLLPKRYRRKAIIVENTVDIDALDYCNDYVYNKNSIRICVTGSISVSRGIVQLLKAIDNIDNIEVIAIGILHDAFANNQFLLNPKVKYLGFTTQNEAIKIASTCDAIFAFYEPSTINNLYASPNKVFDAMAIGKPIIMNCEVKIADWVMQEKLGYIVPFGDHEKLAIVLQGLTKEREGEIEFAKRTRQLFKDKYSWKAMKNILFKAYEKLM